MIKLTILGAPWTKKNSPRIVPIGKGYRLLPSKAYEQYETAALWQIRRPREPISSTVNVKCV